MADKEAVMTPVAVQDGEAWGDFYFSNAPASIDLTKTPAAVSIGAEVESIPFDHPGYREFESVDELLKFLNGRVVVLAPAALPDGVELFGAWAVELADGTISDTEIAYGFAGSDYSNIRDPDVSIGSTYRLARPVVLDSEETFRSNGQKRGTPQRLSVLGQEAVYLPFDNPSDLHPSLQFRA